MINLKNNKGVTLVILIVTIIVLLIITGITITLSIDSIDQTIDTQDTSEMRIIQHAIQERYVEYTQTKNAELLVGTKHGSEEFEYKLDNENDSDGKTDFEKLGVTGEGVIGSEFIVNYETGYVRKVNSATPPLEGYNKDASGDITSFEVDI